MKTRARKLLSVLICFLFIFEQAAFAQVPARLDMAGQFNSGNASVLQDKFRPVHLRYLRYDASNNNFKLLLDRGDRKNESSAELDAVSKELLQYFLIGLRLPNETFWVNLRPDSPDTIIDDKLAQTDIGRIMLETDLQLKRDVAGYASPRTPEGRQYWDKLYKKAAEIFGSVNGAIPTITRPWIIPDEIIIRETTDSAYIYKATLKVMLEQEYLKDSPVYDLKDERSRKLNAYSTQLIRELILPKLNKEINSSKRYAALRQVFYSLIIAQWFKARFAGKDTVYSRTIDQKVISPDLYSKTPWSKMDFFNDYQKSFKDGECIMQEHTGLNQAVRSYFTGGEIFNLPIPSMGGITRNPAGTTISSIPAAAVPDSNPNVVIEMDVGMNAIRDLGRPQADGGMRAAGKRTTPFRKDILPRDSANLLLYSSYQLLVKSLTDDQDEVRKETLTALSKIALSVPELTDEMIGYLFESLRDPDYDVRQAAFDALCLIAKARAELAPKIVNRFYTELAVDYKNNQEIAIAAIGAIAQSRPEMAQEIVSHIVPMVDVQNSGSDACIATMKTLSALIMHLGAESAQEIANSMYKNLARSGDWEVRLGAAESLGVIAQSRPELSPEISGHFMEQLKDRDSDVREQLIRSLEAIAQSNSELKPVIAKLLSKRFNDSRINRDLRNENIQLLGVIGRIKPEISAEIANALLEMLKYDPDQVLETLGDITQLDQKAVQLILTHSLQQLNIRDSDSIISALKALGIILAARPEFKESALPEIKKFLNSGSVQIRLAALETYGIVMARSGATLVRENLPMFSDKLEDGDSAVRQKATEVLGEIVQAIPELKETILPRIVKKSSDDQMNVRVAVGKVLVNAAVDSRSELIDAVIAGFDHVLNSGSWSIRQRAVQSLGAIAKAYPDRATELKVLIKERLRDSDNDVQQAVVDALLACAISNPELEEEIVSALVARVGMRNFHGNGQRAAVKTIEAIVKARPELLTWEFALLFVRALQNKDWQTRIVASRVLTGMITAGIFDFNDYNYFKSEFLNPEGEFRLRESNFIHGFLIASHLLENGDDFDVWLKFSDETADDFTRYTQLLATGILEFRSETMAIAKEKNSVHEACLALEELFLSQEDLSLYAFTRSWNNLTRWMQYRSVMTSQIAVNHIIVNMKLVQQGIGVEEGFRDSTDIEDSLPRIRRYLGELLDQPLPLITKRRLVKTAALGNSDQIDRLRNEAIQLAREVTGHDTRDGVVGKIRDRIHNRPSPQDLAVVKAYRDYVEKGKTSGLKQLGFKVSVWNGLLALMNVNRSAILKACDELIATLEEVYGEDNVNNIEDYFQDWKDAVFPDHEELIEQISKVIHAKAGGFEYLESLVAARKGLANVSKGLSGEDLLASMQLDNRLEVLYYRTFNELRNGVKFSQGQENAKVLRNLLENAGLNGYGQEESAVIVAELNVLEQKDSCSRQDWMQLYAVYKRIERLLNAESARTILDFQEMAEKMAESIDVEDNIWVENFSSNMFRSDTIYLLSLALKDAKEAAMKQAAVSGWQIVVTGQAEGKVRFLRKASELADVKPDEIIVIDHIPSDAPPVTDVAGIITLREDSLLSHPAIRARQHGIPYAVCPDRKLLKEFDGQWVSIDISGEDVVLNAAKETQRGRGPPLRQNKKFIEIIRADLTDRSIVVMPQSYRSETVGNKAFRLQQIPDGLFPEQFSMRHFSLSFGFFNQVLNLEENASIKKQLAGFKSYVIENPSASDVSATLEQMRMLIQQLSIPDEHLERVAKAIEEVFGSNPNLRLFLRSSTNAEDLAGYQAAGLYDSSGNVRPEKADLDKNIKKVWASIWNDRAFFDRQANGVDSNEVFPAILLQEMVMPDYAFVIHTQNPTDASKDQLIIELVQGLGESLVSGEDEFSGSPYRFTYNRGTGELALVTYASKSRKLVRENSRMKAVFAQYADDQLLTEKGMALIKTIAESAVKVEATVFNGRPQDIEGAIVFSGRPGAVFLQARDQLADGGKKDPTTAVSVSTVKPAVRRETNEGTTPAPKSGFGGIDFRQLPIVTAAIGNLSAGMEKTSADRLSRVNLTAEWSRIEHLVNAGLIPSAQRLKDYVQSSCYKGAISNDIHKIICCISDILRQEEERGCLTDPLLKDILTVLDSAAAARHLEAVFGVSL